MSQPHCKSQAADENTSSGKKIKTGISAFTAAKWRTCNPNAAKRVREGSTAMLSVAVFFLI